MSPADMKRLIIPGSGPVRAIGASRQAVAILDPSNTGFAAMAPVPRRRTYNALMDRRQLGATELHVSVIGLGCQSLGGGLYHRDDAESARTISAAIDAGVNFFDVSDHHSQGIAEEILGRASNGHRQDIYITTKAGYRYSPLGNASLRARYYLKPLRRALRPLKRTLHLFRASQGRYDFRPEYVAAALERSLKRLGTDYVDLYQLYKPSVSTIRDPAFEDTIEILGKLKDSGKIRYYGIACQWVDEALQVLDLPGISTVQVAVNLIEPEATESLVDLAGDRRIAVIARHPKAIGLLTEAGHDIMGDTSYYDRFRRERATRAADFRFLSNGGRTLAQAAIRYTLDCPGVSTVIPRATHRAELTENLGALTTPGLTDREYRQITGIQASWRGRN